MPASGTRQYFLGIAGQQTGPFSDAEVMEKIRAGQVPSDSLVWYEGLPEWQAIGSVEFFKEAFAADSLAPPPDPVNQPVNPKPAAAKPKASSAAPVKKISNAKRDPDEEEVTAISTFATGADALAPVFSGNEFSDPAERGDGRRNLYIGAGVAGAFLLVGIFYFYNPATTSDPDAQPVPKAVQKLSVTDREVEYHRALSEMMSNPGKSLETIRKIAKDNPEDATGKQAVTTIVDYYRQGQHPAEAAAFLLEVNRPLEAYQFYKDDKSATGRDFAERALFKAFENTTDLAKKRDLLVQNVDLLTKNPEKMALALERVRLYVKTFPDAPNPFAYYLKSTEEKITELYGKLSGYFLHTLLAFNDSEFPELKLAGKPIVELRREKPDQYRIVGRYKGKVNLSRDQLEDISIVFWMTNAQWSVVDSDLTIERKKWANSNRQRLLAKTIRGADLLRYMEAVFKVQFPGAGFHEMVDPKKAASLRTPTPAPTPR